MTIGIGILLGFAALCSQLGWALHQVGSVMSRSGWTPSGKWRSIAVDIEPRRALETE